MKIDDKGRTFFRSLDTLRQMDVLNEGIDAYVDDVTGRIFGAIATELGALTKKKNSLANRWCVVEDNESSSRFIAISPVSNDLIRVEFGYTRRKQYGKFPGDPWVGIWAGRTLKFGAIVTAARSTFGRPITDGESKPGYRMFEYWPGWPDLYNGDWVDLHPICSDDGKQLSKAVADRILTITRLLETVPQCLSQTITDSVSEA